VALAGLERTPTHTSSASTDLLLGEEQYQELCCQEQLILQEVLLEWRKLVMTWSSSLWERKIHLGHQIFTL
jgi:hypothetical protein